VARRFSIGFEKELREREESGRRIKELGARLALRKTNRD